MRGQQCGTFLSDLIVVFLIWFLLYLGLILTLPTLLSHYLCLSLSLIFLFSKSQSLSFPIFLTEITGLIWLQAYAFIYSISNRFRSSSSHSHTSSFCCLDLVVSEEICSQQQFTFKQALLYNSISHCHCHSCSPHFVCLCFQFLSPHRFSECANLH